MTPAMEKYVDGTIEKLRLVAEAKQSRNAARKAVVDHILTEMEAIRAELEGHGYEALQPLGRIRLSYRLMLVADQLRQFDDWMEGK